MFDNSDKLETANLEEGQVVDMVINPHNYDTMPSRVTGEIVEYPERHREQIENGDRVMCDITVKCDETGERYTWHMDNGYVSGPNPSLGRRSDMGRFRRFEKA